MISLFNAVFSPRWALAASAVGNRKTKVATTPIVSAAIVPYTRNSFRKHVNFKSTDFYNHCSDYNLDNYSRYM